MARKVLLIDDQVERLTGPLEFFLNQSSLEGGAIEVLSHRDARKALDLLPEGLDLVIVGLDLTGEAIPYWEPEFLPHIKEKHIAYRLLRHIKEHFQGTRVIILANYKMCEAQEDEEAIARAKGADALLGKPFQMADLIKVIERVMASGKG